MTRERNPAAPWRVAAPQQAKALVGALVAGLTTLASAMADDMVTGGEWVGVAIAVAATYGSVFGARNTGRHRGGEGNLNTALSVVALVVLTLLGVLLLSKIT